jgi:hypothetical protein
LRQLFLFPAFPKPPSEQQMPQVASHLEFLFRTQSGVPSFMTSVYKHFSAEKCKKRIQFWRAAGQGGKE